MTFNTLTISIFIAAICGGQAFAPSSAFTRSSTSLQMQESSADVSRFEFFKQAAGLSVASALSSSIAFPAFADDITLPSGVVYSVTKTGDGAKPEIGELAGIRFKAVCIPTGNTIDDLFDNPEPYYTRVGSGGLIKGVEEVIPKMRVGDRFFITIPVSACF